jgi:16S rRNA (cytosine967-C5)-methyltransferase
MYLHSHLKSAVKILQLYKGEIPFASWLKTFFNQNKKYGSRDRKVISNLCYGYFRLGKALASTFLEEKILIAQFLCNKDSPFVHEFRREWGDIASASLSTKIAFLQEHFTVEDIFPWKEKLSPQIEHDAFCISFLVQPLLYLRLRPGKEPIVQNKLKEAGVDFNLESANSLALPNATKVEDFSKIDDEFVIQDLNSQKVLDLLQAQILNKKNISTVWDCCAASGGKSILFYDTFPGVQLTVSDVRESILKNLHNRFKKAGIKQYDSFAADVGAQNFSINKTFDLVICDAPCTGSGTWCRTPEQLYFFKIGKIGHYSNLQKSISTNAAKAVKKGGFFLYITCSVFRQENEDVVKYIEDYTSLRFLSQAYLKGYEARTDTLYTALFTL